MTDLTPSALLDEVRRLIDSARERAAVAINAELTLLYWQVGHRVQAEVLRGSRAEYGQQIISSLARQLTEEYGRGWSDKQLRHCVRLAEVFADEAIVSAVRRELSWTHLKTLIYSLLSEVLPPDDRTSTPCQSPRVSSFPTLADILRNQRMAGLGADCTHSQRPPASCLRRFQSSVSGDSSN